MSTITQTITALPSAPSRSNPATFATLADAFVAALENLPEFIILNFRRL